MHTYLVGPAGADPQQMLARGESLTRREQAELLASWSDQRMADAAAVAANMAAAAAGGGNGGGGGLEESSLGFDADERNGCGAVSGGSATVPPPLAGAPKGGASAPGNFGSTAVGSSSRTLTVATSGGEGGGEANGEGGYSDALLGYKDGGSSSDIGNGGSGASSGIPPAAARDSQATSSYGAKPWQQLLVGEQQRQQQQQQQQQLSYAGCSTSDGGDGPGASATRAAAGIRAPVLDDGSGVSSDGLQRAEVGCMPFCLRRPP